MLLVLVSTAPAAATTVIFAVAPGQIGPGLTGDIDLASSHLNGIALGGQSLSLDLLFDQDLLARMTFGDISVGLTIKTSTPGSPGFAGATTGFLIAPDGSALHTSRIAGLASGSDGSFSAGLVDLTSVLSGVVDVKGVHFDTILPGNASLITGAHLRFSVNPGIGQVTFGTAAQLPEPATGVLLGIVATSSLLVRRWRSRDTKRRSA